MTEKFQETLTRRNRCLNDQAVWEEIIAHLSRFLDSDMAPAKNGIVTRTEEMVVPQENIERIISQIKSAMLNPIRVELGKIDKAEVRHGNQEVEIKSKSSARKG